MYNSFVVRIISKIWTRITFSYNSSFLKTIVDNFKKILKRISSGSIVISLLIEDNGLIDNSLVYKAYSQLFLFIDDILEKFKKVFDKIKQNSFISKSRETILFDIESLLYNFYLFIFSFSVAMILINLKKQSLNLNSSKVAFIFLLVSVLGLKFNKIIIAYYNESLINKFVTGIFSLDEGGDQWW